MHAERAATRLSLRQIWFGAVVTVAATGVLLWLGTVAYHKSQKSSGSVGVVALGGNPAVRALLGLPTAIHTLGGFSVWRVQLFVMIIGPVWTVLATTRILRGNEETGRLDLMLATPLSLIGATVASLLALLAACVLTTVTAASVLWGSGAPPAGSWLYGAGIGLLLATFAAVAALTSQILPDRRRATGAAVAVLSGMFVLRMFADGSDGAGWVRWLTPFGWVENLHAFGGNDLLPLLPLVLVPLALVGGALMLAHRRDTGAGVVRASDTAQLHTALLTAPLTLATRRRSRDVIGWALGMLVLGLLSGGLAQSFVGFQQTQPEYVKMLEKAGLGAAVTPVGWVAIMDVFAAVVLACYGVAVVHADYDDETATRLDLPYSDQVTRTGWAGSTVLTATVGLMVLTVVYALATWAGSGLAGAGVSGGDSFAGAMNAVPVALLFLGLAMLVHGIWPAWTAGLVGGMAVGTYMIELIGPGLSWPSWALDLSPYHQLALVPVDPAAWTALVVLIAVALAFTGLSLAAYARRDLR